jgi:hypothetical protein
MIFWGKKQESRERETRIKREESRARKPRTRSKYLGAENQNKNQLIYGKSQNTKLKLFHFY